MKVVIPSDYQPNDEVLQRLAEVGVDADFARALVPEFVIYWQERGYKTFSWSSKFLNHAMYEWRRYETMLAQGRATIKMHAEWKPVVNVLWILAGQLVPEEFVMACLPEFRLYWMDRGDICNTWNNKFIGHVRYRWQSEQMRLASIKPVRHVIDNDRSWATGGSDGKAKY